jgi:hypothetical protein
MPPDLDREDGGVDGCVIKHHDVLVDLGISDIMNLVDSLLNPLSLLKNESATTDTFAIPAGLC